jgi:hypothetical protein
MMDPSEYTLIVLVSVGAGTAITITESKAVADPAAEVAVTENTNNPGVLSPVAEVTAAVGLATIAVPCIDFQR